MRMNDVVRQAIIALLVGVAYTMVGYLGVAGKVPPAGMPTVWPPAAVILAALMLTPRRLWWSYLVVVGPAHVILMVTCMPGMPAAALAVQFVGYGVQAVLAAEVLRRFGDSPPRFDDLRSVTRFVLIGVVGAIAITTTAVAYLYTWTGWVSDYRSIWGQRVIANAIPTLILTPFIVLTVQSVRAPKRGTSAASFAELALLMAAMVAVSFAVFGADSSSRHAFPALLYALLPLVLWAAVRFRPTGLYACLVTIAFVSLFNAHHGRGLFDTLSRTENVLALQLFLVAISLPMMLLAAMVQERRRTERALMVSQQRYSLATAAGSVGVWDWNLTTNEIYLDPAIKRMLGFEDHEIENTMDAWTRHMHPDDVESVLGLVREHVAGVSPMFEAEHRVFHKNGTIRWLLCRGVVVEHVNGVPVRMTGTDTDVTEHKFTEYALQSSNDRVRELAGRLISAQEEERRRIARDLHDGLNQKVAAISIEISRIKQRLPRRSAGLTEQLTQLQGRTSELAGDIRELSHEIHPATLEHAGLVPALTSFAAELERLEDVHVDLALPKKSAGIPPHVATCLYRVAQESIRNAIRHAGVKRVSLALTVDDDGITFSVSDEGRGFDTELISESRGLGLISIEERVRLLNGRLEVHSRIGRGTTVRVHLPHMARDMVEAHSS